MWHNAFYSCVYVCCVSKGCNRRHQGCSTCSTCCHCRRGPQLKLKQELELRMELRMKLPLAVCAVIKFFVFIIWCNLNRTETGCDSSFSYFFSPFESVKFFNCISLGWYPTISRPLSLPLGICCPLEEQRVALHQLTAIFSEARNLFFTIFLLVQQIFVQSTLLFSNIVICFFLLHEFVVRFWGICCDFSNF